MNALEHTVLEVLVEPHKTENGDWNVTIMEGCWGKCKSTKRGSEEYVKKFVKGYKWVG